MTSHEITDEELLDISSSSLSSSESGSKTLDGRLLCAAVSAYEIKSPYFRCASYLPHTTAKRITRSINSALIGRTIDGIVVAFRGTLSNSPLDWFQNSATLLSPALSSSSSSRSSSEAFRGGSVHVGFYRAVKALWDGIKSIILDLLNSSDGNKLDENNTKIYLTGHSKGGAMASLAAVLMHFDAELPNPAYVCTFGSARVGDGIFQEIYNKNIHQTSYENHLDLIPFLPPSSSAMNAMDDETTAMVDSLLWSKEEKNNNQSKKKKYSWGYQTVGQRKFIDSNSNILESVTRKLDESRIKEFEKKTIIKFDLFREAHRSDCEGGYFKAIAPEVCQLTTNEL